MIKDVAVLSPLYVTIFWGIVLIANSPKEKPKFLLGIFMFVAFFLYLIHAFFFTNNYLVYFHTESLYLLTSLTVYPLYFCYIKLLTIETSFKKKNLVYFIPAVLLAAASFIVGFFFNDQQRLDYVDAFLIQRDRSGMTLLSPGWIKSSIFIICRVLFVGQVFFYLLKGAILTQQHDRRIANFYSNTEGKSLVWVRMVTFSFLVTSIMSITFAIIGRNTFLHDEYLLLVPSIIFSVLLYIIGYLGNITNRVLVATNLNQFQSTNSKVTNSESVRERILNLFTQHEIFKNPNLLITNLSESLNTTSDNVSKLINEEFKTDFNNFVNNYRIRVAKELIDRDKDNKFALDCVAADSGFGSLNSFTRVFKSYEGITPQKFREICRQRDFS